MTKDQLNELLSISDIGLACYAKDAPQSIPNKIIEYMSAGMPILSSLKGETKELLGENSCGLTYDPEDLSDFMSKLSILESYNLRGDMSKNAISLFNDNFDADKVYGEYVHYLESFVQD
jgi:glycosyltransferase involved in cell wall biosynthesis